MARHRASPVTVQRAIARLAQEGLVVPRPGRGTYVAEHAGAAAECAADTEHTADADRFTCTHRNAIPLEVGAVEVGAVGAVDQCPNTLKTCSRLCIHCSTMSRL
jgi:DNA-binding FadR family transcriptional regulator